MTKDQELVEKIAKWCAISCNSDLPYQFHAKEIISLCRQHDMQMAIEAVESVKTYTHMKESDFRSELKEAIRERFSDE